MHDRHPGIPLQLPTASDGGGRLRPPRSADPDSRSGLPPADPGENGSNSVRAEIASGRRKLRAIGPGVDRCCRVEEDGVIRTSRRHATRVAAAGHGSRRKPVRAGLLVAAGSLLFASAAVATSPEAGPGTPVRVAYTSTVLQNVSEGDAKAAIRVWGEAIARELDVVAHAEVEIVPDAGTLRRLFQDGQADLGSMTAREFFEVESELDIDPLLAILRGGEPTVTYLLLVRDTGGPRSVGELRGRELRVLDTPQTELALPWLDTWLHDRGEGSVAETFGPVTTSSKLSAVVLPVFFGQATACLVPRDGFAAMTELNPQVGRDLRILIESPEYVPTVSFLRRGFTPTFRDDLIASILNFSASPTGRQVLNLLQSDGMIPISAAELQPTRDLVQTWSRQKASARPRTATKAVSKPLAGGTP